MFQFKQFTIQDDRSSLKVGTDGVLLGTWAAQDVCDNDGGLTILDIGSGSGLISLMMAQRFPKSHVLGVDIDEASVIQARENVMASPFADRISIELCDARDMKDGKYDIVVCNPPFYTEDTVSPDEIRANARNVKSLPFEELVHSACSLMSADGVFAVMLPTTERNLFVNICHANGMHLSRECLVKTVVRKAPKRVLLQFDFQQHEDIEKGELVLQENNGKRSSQYSEFCKDFYL